MALTILGQIRRVRNYISTNGGATWIPDPGASGGGGGASTIADGADVALGATTDVAVAGDSAGTMSAKLRGLLKLWADVWDSVNHWLKVSIQNTTLAVTQGGTWTVQPGNTANTTAWKVDGSAVNQPVVGNVAHDGVDSGAPVKTGSRAVSFGSNPVEVAAADRVDALASISGIPFVLPGHPNIITRRDTYAAAQTDTKLITVSAGTKIVVVSCTITLDAACTVKPLVRAGFAATNTPTGAGVYISHPGLSPGSGVAEGRVPVAGADGEDFIFTCAAPTTGNIDVVTKYFTVAS